MKLQVLLAVTCLMAVSARHHGKPHHRPEVFECLDVLFPHEGRENFTSIVHTCIEDLELEEILEEIEGEARRHRNPVEELEENGYTAEALKLRTCVAEALGLVADDDSFDADAFIEYIEESAAGTPQEPNIALGIENCPTDGFDEFDTHDFIKCVLTYCATGEAPPEPSSEE